MENEIKICSECGNEEKSVDSTGLCEWCRIDQYNLDSQQDDFD